MALGDVSISDARYLSLAGTNVSKALLSCNARIMYELIESEYTFGEQGRRTSVSTHYTWKLDIRLRVDKVAGDGTIGTLITEKMPSPLGAVRGLSLIHI